ncbi:hypothetical protein E4T47_02324 [Aureobasidium subglaciale]|nr:hypothetical protein E4T47_02324 [Aureobasidium subglaciale]
MAATKQTASKAVGGPAPATIVAHNSTDVSEPAAKRQKISVQHEFIYGPNVVVLRAYGNVVTLVPLVLFKEGCLCDVPLDEASFWNEISTGGGVTSKALDFITQRRIVRFLALWIHDHDVSRALVGVDVEENEMSEFLFECYSDLVGRAISSNDLQRDLIDCFVDALKTQRSMLPPDEYPLWLLDAFYSYERGSYQDKRLRSLFTALFIYHHPGMIQQERSPEL